MRTHEKARDKAPKWHKKAQKEAKVMRKWESGAAKEKEMRV